MSPHNRCMNTGGSARSHTTPGRARTGTTAVGSAASPDDTTHGTVVGDAGADDVPLPGGPRPLRRLAPPHAPWPAVLACGDNGEHRLLVDARSLRGWAGWRMGGEAHVAGVCDLVRRPGGHDAVLPACTRRLDDYLRSRTSSSTPAPSVARPAAGRRGGRSTRARAPGDARRAGPGDPLGAGEVVTLAVSMLRGCARLCDGGRAPAPLGGWWLCDDGRPMFVHDADAQTDVVAAARGLLEVLRGASAACATGADAGADIDAEVADHAVSSVRAAVLHDAVAAACRLLSQPRAIRSGVVAVEDALFAAAAPAPLAAIAPTRGRTALPARAGSAWPAPAGSTSRPRPAADAVTDAAAGATIDGRDDVPVPIPVPARRAHRGRTRGRVRGVARWMTHAVAAARAVGADRRNRHSRRLPLLAAGAAAAAVLVIGMAWPSGGISAETAQADPPPATPSTATSGAAPPERPAGLTAATPGGAPQASGAHRSAPAADPSPSAGAFAHALLRERLACADDACRRRLQEDPRLQLPAGAVDVDEDDRTVTLIDDFGGAVVLRVHPRDPTIADQLVVAVRADGRWLLRDVHAITQQPSGS